MPVGGQKSKNQKKNILDENEKFERRKCAYFLRNMSGKGSFKNFFIFFNYPLGHFYKVKIPLSTI
jgi:hypothetical protein